MAAGAALAVPEYVVDGDRAARRTRRRSPSSAGFRRSAIVATGTGTSRRAAEQDAAAEAYARAVAATRRRARWLTRGARRAFAAATSRSSAGRTSASRRCSTRWSAQKISITSKKAQTTRHRDHRASSPTRDAQFVFVDTPGFQTQAPLAPQRPDEPRGDARAWPTSMRSCWCSRRARIDRRPIARWSACCPPACRSIAALNKVDRAARTSDALLPQMAELAALHPVRGDRAGERGEGHAARRAAGARSRALLPEAPPLYRRGRAHRPRRALPRRRVRPREDLPAAGRRGALRDDGRRSTSFEQEGALRRIHATIYVDQREPAGDPARRGRRADEGDRDAARAPTWSGCSAARSSSRSGCA